MPGKKTALLLALLSATILSCGQSPVEFAQNFIANRAPEIIQFTDDYEGNGSDITAGTQINITVEAQDPEGEPLTYSFSGIGSFQNTTETSTGCQTEFVVGNITGGQDITVTVTIRDIKGASISQTLNIAQSALGPQITRTDSNSTDIIPEFATSFTFQATSNGYYQIRNNATEPLTSANAIDNSLPIWSYTKDTPVTINVYHQSFAGVKIDPPPPYVVLKDELADPVLLDHVYVIVIDKINQMSYHKITYSLDSTPPVPGNSGSISLSNVQYTSARLDWQKASDAIDIQSNLQYKVVYSTSNNISSVANAESNGTVFQVIPGNDWSTNISTATVTGLALNTDYYFNVVVKDSRNNKAAYTTAMTHTLNDPTPPVPGNSGIISVTGLTDQGLTLNWTKATDSVWDQTTLQYKIVRSELNNVSTLDQIETQGNGTVICDWTTNINTLAVTGLSRSKTYYFNVVVIDGAGNKTVYTTVSATTLNTVYMFATTAYYRGGFGGRSGANGLCQSEYTTNYSHLGASNVYALISVNSDDEIRDMPDNYSVPTTCPIRSSNNTIISSNWAGLLDGGVDNSMIGAGVVTSFVHYYWTGSFWDGSLAGHNCSNWTQSSDGYYGEIGDPNTSTPQWLDYQGSPQNPCYSATRKVLCVCW